MRGRERLVLWPLYFDSAISRRRGRRVPRAKASKDVTAEEVFKAALDMGLNPELQAGAAHPTRPWDRRGAILVERSGPKRGILAEVAARIVSRRGGAQGMKKSYKQGPVLW